MILLNAGQRPLLEFLRNLTPQVLLATTALLLGARLDFGRFDLSNWGNTAVFYACTALLALAFLINMNQFLDGLVDSLVGYGRLTRRLRLRGVSKRKVTIATLLVMFRQRRTLFIDLVATVVIVEVALIAIAFAALSAARTALR